jgi:hypothetical protein
MAQLAGRSVAAVLYLDNDMAARIGRGTQGT